MNIIVVIWLLKAFRKIDKKVCMSCDTMMMLTLMSMMMMKNGSEEESIEKG